MNPDKLDNLPPHIKALVLEAREGTLDLLVLKLLDGFQHAAASLNTSKAIAISGSELDKSLDDLDRAFTTFLTNNMTPIVERVKADPGLRIKDA